MKKKDELQAFYIEQITTTKKLIKTFGNTDEFSPTLLLNCLLSLVVLPYEKAKKKNGDRIFPGEYKNIEKKLGFSPATFQPIKSCKDGKLKYSRKTIYTYINKFRNGIAHQNLEIHVGDNRDISIKIYNKFAGQDCKKCAKKICSQKGLRYESGGIIDYEIIVTVKQLQKLAFYIADSYLKAIK